jgi:hypothetical protein
MVAIRFCRIRMPANTDTFIEYTADRGFPEYREPVFEFKLVRHGR